MFRAIAIKPVLPVSLACPVTVSVGEGDPHARPTRYRQIAIYGCSAHILIAFSRTGSLPHLAQLRGIAVRRIRARQSNRRKGMTALGG